MPKEFYDDNVNSTDYREEVLIKHFEANLDNISIDNIVLNMDNIDLNSLLVQIFGISDITVNDTLGDVMKSMHEQMIELSSQIDFNYLQSSNKVKILSSNLQKNSLIKYICK